MHGKIVVVVVGIVDVVVVLLVDVEAVDEVVEDVVIGSHTQSASPKQSKLRQ
jgi:hypothetical protein